MVRTACSRVARCRMPATPRCSPERTSSRSDRPAAAARRRVERPAPPSPSPCGPACGQPDLVRRVDGLGHLPGGLREPGRCCRPHDRHTAVLRRLCRRPDSRLNPIGRGQPRHHRAPSTRSCSSTRATPAGRTAGADAHRCSCRVARPSSSRRRCTSTRTAPPRTAEPSARTATAAASPCRTATRSASSAGTRPAP